MTHVRVTHRPRRTLASLIAAGVMLTQAGSVAAQSSAGEQASAASQPAQAAEATVKLKIRPHCEKSNPSECPQYAVKDPVTVETPILIPGSIIDMDIMIENPTFMPIRRSRVWLSYDPNVLEGKKIEVGRRFPVVTPGEADFNVPQGFVQIGVGAEGTTEVKDPFIPVARLQFMVKAAPEGGKTVISYYDVLPGLQGHTFVTRTDPSGTGEQNVLHPGVGSLFVRIEAPAATASSAAATSEGPAPSSQAAVSSALAVLPTMSSAGTAVSSAGALSSAATSSETSLSPTDPGRSSFVLLQVQSVRVTTEGSTVYLAWDHLQSSELQGYNVYYGAESGRYVQRRSLPKDANTLAIRALPLDTTYYFAIRGVNATDEESAFSQEVAVKVGNPATSTAPLAQVTDPGPGGQNPIDGPRPPAGTPGETGLPSTLLLLLLGSAVIGTMFAFRRQVVAVSHLHQ